MFGHFDEQSCIAARDKKLSGVKKTSIKWRKIVDHRNAHD